jgi:hypothetical protein
LRKILQPCSTPSDDAEGQTAWIDIFCKPLL